MPTSTLRGMMIDLDGEEKISEQIQRLATDYIRGQHHNHSTLAEFSDCKILNTAVAWNGHASPGTNTILDGLSPEEVDAQFSLVVLRGRIDKVVVYYTI